MKIDSLKFVIFLFLLTIFTVLIFNFKNDLQPQKSISQYYEILRDQEKTLNGEVISQDELNVLQNCANQRTGENPVENDPDQNCFKQYFYKLNASTTLEKTFSNLALLMKDHPEYIDYCHQITHGIGNSELVKQNGDLGKALEEFDTGKYFKNISTCGSGYFHGLIEQSVKNITDKNQLVDTFKNICTDKTVEKVAGSDCIHGLGHATYIQTNFNLADSMFVCDNVDKDDYSKFNCYTGVFMEANLELPAVTLIQKKSDNTFNFLLCSQNNLTTLQHRACIFESVLQFRNSVPDRNDYSQMMGLCKTIKDPVDRMACVKNISIRSIIDVGYQDVNKMCLKTGLTSGEEIMCVSVFAHRIAQSLEGTKNANYYKEAEDICKNLPIKYSGKCVDLIKNKPEQLYLVSEKDLNI